MTNDKNGGEYEAITEFKCFINNKELENCARKPDWCPLREVPQKLLKTGEQWVDGYNACIDEILKM